MWNFYNILRTVLLGSFYAMLQSLFLNICISVLIGVEGNTLVHCIFVDMMQGNLFGYRRY